MHEQVQQLAECLHQEGQTLHSQLAALSAEQWATPIYSEGQPWQARDVLAHLVAAERGHQMLIANVAGGGPGAPADLDVDRYNQSTVAALADRAVADLLADFLAVRTETVALVNTLTDADLERRGQHPALGPDTDLAAFIGIVLVHGKLHLRDLRRAFTAPPPSAR